MRREEPISILVAKFKDILSIKKSLQQHGANNGTASATSSAEIQQAAQPQATTVSPVNEMGRQIALEFCTEFWSIKPFNFQQKH